MTAQVAVIDRSGAEDWDEILWQQPAANLYASRSWGQYKSRLGWTVRQVALNDNGADLAYIQYQERRTGPVRRILVQGGAVLTAPRAVPG
ncbi:UNVERIFIED_ORG: hypothetical protein M2438_002471 [Methylobacterium sp. SuP10 SLI 274]|nr:hypothetical protein [Methylobacterium sp. SuP10 SLI 274]